MLCALKIGKRCCIQNEEHAALATDLADDGCKIISTGNGKIRELERPVPREYLERLPDHWIGYIGCCGKAHRFGFARADALDHLIGIVVSQQTVFTSKATKRWASLALTERT